tara:strand:+ start:125 stop:904 length:780 start_codon:yes stop_codon:yes gene_type:complete
LEQRKIKGKSHYVYDHISEFYNEHPNIAPLDNWRNGKEGDWVWSDDRRIVQLLKVSDIKHPKDRKNYKFAKGWCRTIVGTFLIRDNTYMDTSFESHKNRYTFSKTIKNTGTRVKERKKVTNKEKEFATNVVVGMGAVKSYMKAFNELNGDKAQKKAAILLKQERVMKEIEKSAMDIAKELGVDHEYIISKLKHLADFSEDDNMILQATKELGKAIGTLGTMVKQKEMGIIGMFQGFSPEQLESVDRAKLVEDTKLDVKK